MKMKPAPLKVEFAKTIQKVVPDLIQIINVPEIILDVV